jgi:hypothetical protein
MVLESSSPTDSKPTKNSGQISQPGTSMEQTSHDPQLIPPSEMRLHKDFSRFFYVSYLSLHFFTFSCNGCGMMIVIIGGLPVDSVGVYRVRSEVSNFRITDPYRMSIPLTF